jgi:hypothetical protein
MRLVSLLGCPATSDTRKLGDQPDKSISTLRLIGLKVASQERSVCHAISGDSRVD